MSKMFSNTSVFSVLVSLLLSRWCSWTFTLKYDHFYSTISWVEKRKVIVPSFWTPKTLIGSCISSILRGLKTMHSIHIGFKVLEHSNLKSTQAMLLITRKICILKNKHFINTIYTLWEFFCLPTFSILRWHASPYSSNEASSVVEMTPCFSCLSHKHTHS